MNQLFLLGDEPCEVALTRPDDLYRLYFDGAVLTVSLHDLANGLSRLTVDGAATDLRLALDGDTVWIQLDGACHRLRYVDPVARFADDGAGAAHDIATAPMPGTVILLQVAAGQAVRRGDTLLVIESMKLETAIRAWRDGLVAVVHVTPGATFDRGAKLVTLAAES